MDTHIFAADKDALAATVFAFTVGSANPSYISDGETRVDLVVVPETHAALPREIDPEIRAMIAPESSAVSIKVALEETDRPEDRDRRMPTVTFVDEQTVLVRTRGDRDTEVRFGPDFGPRLRAALGSPDGVGVETAYLTLLPTTKVGALVTVASSLGVHRAAEVHLSLIHI